MPETKMRTFLVRLSDDEKVKLKVKLLKEGKTSQGALRQLILSYIADTEES